MQNLLSSTANFVTKPCTIGRTAEIEILAIFYTTSTEAGRSFLSLDQVCENVNFLSFTDSEVKRFIKVYDISEQN